MSKQPFFSRYLEAQEMERVTAGASQKPPVTLKYPSDQDEPVTMKYPSDGDDTDPGSIF